MILKRTLRRAVIVASLANAGPGFTARLITSTVPTSLRQTRIMTTQALCDAPRSRPREPLRLPLNKREGARH
jgi:hypothetical protein